MTEEGRYIYCIINENKEKDSGYIGIDPIEEFRKDFSLEKSNLRSNSKFLYGINNREVKLVPYKDIAAVVSSAPIINFDRLNKKELTEYATTHQKVNELVMSAKGAVPAGRQGSASGGKEYDVVPMTFGIIAPSVSEVLRILEKAYLQFKIAIKNIAGKAEFVVQVWWNPKKLLEELANINPEIQKLKQEIVLKGGISGMRIKLKLGKLIQEEVETQRKIFINDIHTFLKKLSHDYTLNKLIDDEMIANFSFLIERAREPELDKKMSKLGKKYEGKLRFKYIGPMPPYSFVNINLSLGNFELVNKAKETLGLGEEVTLEEIKKTYYGLARQYHPDKLQGDETQMKRLSQAYSTLENYCQSCDEISGSKSPARLKRRQKYSFKKEDIENSLIIK